MISSIVTFAVLPVVLYLALAALPRGRPAFLGLAVAGTLAVLGAGVLVAVDLGGTGLAMAILSFAAVILAALVQAVRRALSPGRPVWLYPGIVMAALVAGTLPVILNLGA
jgi:hypothetical protein